MPQLNIAQLVRIYGPETTVEDIRRRLVCTACGRRTENLRLVYRGPGGRAASFNYQ